MKTKTTLSSLLAVLLLASCSENYSNGERIGVITQFSKTGVIWKSYEGHLNVTQTGMNSSVPFDFSIDNDNPDDLVIRTLDSAANLGWKVKLVYHETVGKNWFGNRGDTNHFITKVDVLDKNFGQQFGSHAIEADTTTYISNTRRGGVVDTIYVVIDKSKD